MATTPETLNQLQADRDEQLTITVAEFAARVGISRTLAYLACQRGEVPSILIGRRRLIPRRALEAFLAGQSVSPTSR